MARKVIETITESSGPVRQKLSVIDNNGAYHVLEVENYRNDKFVDSDEWILYDKVPKLQGRKIKDVIKEVNDEFVDTKNGRVHKSYV